MCWIAARLDIRVIDALRDIMNEEHTNFLIKKKQLRTSDTAVAIGESNCCAFQKFIAFLFSQSCSALL